jgi:hypothetical protein
MLNRIALLIVFFVLPCSALAETDDRVTVEFAEPDRYLDAGDRPRDKERNLNSIEGFLVTEVGRCLAEGERVEIRVLDIDLAGRFEWWHRPEGVRVLRNVDFPRMKLEYQLFGADGQVVYERREWVTDMDYLHRGARVPARRALENEERMIRDWAQRQFCRRD